jgi:hypothetical protein
VQFTVEKPQRCDYCHGSICRRLHSAPFVVWGVLRKDDLHITAGQQEVKLYQSSEHAMRTSCVKCGSWFFFESTGWPGMVDVALASLPEDCGIIPRAHVYWADREPRVEFNDDLPEYLQDYGVEMA